MSGNDKIIDVDTIEEGMKAADDIMGLDGSIIVRKGIELNNNHMSLLKHAHVSHIRVLPPDAKEAAKDSIHIDDYPSQEEVLKSARILVVDDSKFLRFKLGKMLQDAGLNVVGQAGDGNEAVEALNKLDPNVFTLDVEMPNCDGLAALDRIRSIKPDAVCVMVSSVGEEDKILEAIARGAVDFVNKPIDPVKTVKSVINAIIIERAG